MSTTAALSDESKAASGLVISPPDSPPLVTDTALSAAPRIDIPPLPAAPMPRRRAYSALSKQSSTRKETRFGHPAPPLPRYLAPTAAAAARRRDVPTLVHDARTAATSGRAPRVVKNEAPTPSSPSPTSADAAPAAATPPFVEATLDAQLHSSEPALSSSLSAQSNVPALLRDTYADTSTIVDVRESKKSNTNSVGGVGVTKSAKPRVPRRKSTLAAAFIQEDEDEEEIFGEREEEGVRHTSPRLLPLPPPIAASSQVAAALADVLGHTGVDGALTEALLEPRRMTSTSTQAALAAERAALLHDSLDASPADDVAVRRNVGGGRRGVWSPSSPASGAARRRSAAVRAVASAVTPAVIAEFLKVEADAEAAVAEERAKVEERQQQQRQQQTVNPSLASVSGGAARAAAVPRRQRASRASLSPFSQQQQQRVLTLSAPMAESTAVLRELEAMQHRLNERGYHRRSPVDNTDLPPSAKLQQQQLASAASPPTKGYGSSPCDVSSSASASSSFASSSSTSSVARGATTDRQHGRPALQDWTAASVSEVVDALDRATLTSRAAQVQRQRRGGHASSGKSRDFDPEVYVRSLLEGRDHDGSDDDGGDAFRVHADVDDVGVDSFLCTHRRSGGSPRRPAVQREMQNAALRRGGGGAPSLSTAAFEVGVTPSEVRELLRYSVSAPAAEAWLSKAAGFSSSGGGADTAGRGSVPAMQSSAAERDYRENDASPKDTKSGRDQSTQQKPRSPKSYALDAATQTALVHRILSALPAVPAGLAEEMAKQRRLLERVCRDVAVATTPVHAATRERATSPTVASVMARQPPPIDLTTPSDGAEGRQRNTSAAAAAAAERESYEATLASALPRPAVQALISVAGLRSSAADLSRPLPPFQAVVARPGAPPPVARVPSSQPYEAALQAMSEREARHYARELDRLRTCYDRHLNMERQERRMEQRQYAALLQHQQEKMLRHHRETVHLLQRESRLQQQQQESVVQQLAAAQAAATERQQAEQTRVTRQMLSGAVEAMRSRCVTPAEMDTGVGVGAGATTPTTAAAARSAAAKLERAKRIAARTSAAAVSSLVVPSASKTEKPATTSPPPSSPSQEKQQKKKTTRSAVVHVEEPDVGGAEGEEGESAVRTASPSQMPFDANIPTLDHLAPLQRSHSTQVEPGENGVTSAAAAAAAAAAESIQSGPHKPQESGDDRDTEAPSIADSTPASQRRHERRAPAKPMKVRTARPAAAAHTGYYGDEGGNAGGPPSASAPTLRLSTTSDLRSVYGDWRGSRDTHLTTSPHQPAATSAAAPPPARMTLPLQAHLPPEDELDRHLRRVAAATMVVDSRAVAAAEAAGLASGTRLYAVAPPRRPRKVGGEDEKSGTSKSSVKTAARHFSAPPAVRRSTISIHGVGRPSPASSPAHQGQQQHRRGPQGRSRTQPSRRRQGSSTQQQPRLQQQHGAHGAAQPLSRFDLEIVSVLSGVSEDGSQAEGAFHHTPFAWQQHQQQHHHLLGGLAHPSTQLHGTPYANGGAAAAAAANAWSSIHVSDKVRAPPRTDVGLTAGRPSVGPTLLLLSDPAVLTPHHTSEATRQRSFPFSAGGVAAAGPAAVAPPWSAHVSPAAALTQVVNAELQQAQHERERRVAELRDAGERQATLQRISAATPEVAKATAAAALAGLDDVAGASSPPPQAVGVLPPCDADFFGATADIVLASHDAADTPFVVSSPQAITNNTATAAAAGGASVDASHTDRRGRYSTPDDFDNILLAHPADPVLPLRRGFTDYARAWARYEAAAADVEGAAAAVAVEDAGVLEAFARIHRGSGAPPLARTSVLQPPRTLASAAAAVRYREQQLLSLQGEGDVPLDGEGGAFVSPKMAEKARTLTAARQRLAQIRACFIAPPSAVAAEAAFAPAVAARTDAAVVRRLVDETVFSLMEQEGERQRDPVQRVISAIEHELLRLLLEERLGATDTAALSTSVKARSPTALQDLEPALMQAVMEAAVEDAVRSIMAQRSAQDKDTAAPPPLASPQKEETDRRALTRALQRLAEDSTTDPHTALSSGISEEARERVAVPVVPSTAWLHDVTPESVTETRDDMHSATAAGAGGGAAGGTVAVAPNPSPSSPSATTTVSNAGGALVVAGDSSLANVCGAASAIRIVLDLSPAARHLLCPYDPTAAPLSVTAVRPPMQYEQLPRQWMAAEDRRDVIVEAELRPAFMLPPLLSDAVAEEKAVGGSSGAHHLGRRAGVDAAPALSLPGPSPPQAGNKEAVTTAAVETEKGRHEGDGLLSISVHPPSSSLKLPPPPPPPAVATGAAAAATTATKEPVSTASSLLVPLNGASNTGASLTTPSLPALKPPNATMTHSEGLNPSVQLPPQPRTAESIPLVLSVLLTHLIDLEGLQRSGLLDREEEQRESLWRLRAVVASDHRRVLFPARPPLRDAVAADPPTATTASASALAAAVEKAVVAALPSPPVAASTAVTHAGPATARLPPVRDPVMSAVLEWVYQFDGAKRGPAAGGGGGASPDLVANLQAAARTAAATPAAEDSDVVAVAEASSLWLDDRYVVAFQPGSQVGIDPAAHWRRVTRRAFSSQASTRNLGSTTRTTTTTEPSLPSSLRTDSSSSSMTDTHWASSVIPARQQRHRTATVSSTRPIVDVHSLGEPYRRGATPAKKVRGAVGSSAASDTATTRYTSTDSARIDEQRSQPQERRSADREEKDGGEACGAVVGSAVLPQRVSAEVQAAFEAALRSHRLAAAEESNDHRAAMTQQQLESPALACAPSVNESVMLEETSAVWPESSHYAVTLPPHSAETSRLETFASPASGRRRRPLRRRSPVNPHPHSRKERDHAASSGVSVAKGPPQNRRGTAPPQTSGLWEGYSFTSTSTSSHGGAHSMVREVGSQQHQQPVALSTSALPFLS